MNKKNLIPIVFIVLLIIGWQWPSYSQSDLPYPVIQEGTAAGKKPPLCQQQFINQMHGMRQAWETNLELMTTQEKPASKMVDEAFESARTYRCWLEYLCRAVRYSGDVSSKNADKLAGLSLTKLHIGAVPGCVDPEDIEIPGIQLQYLNHCQVSPADLVSIDYNYQTCLAHLELEFADVKSNPGKSFAEKIRYAQNRSNVFLKLESVLREVSAKQRARAIEEKLMNILNKMHGMESHAQNLKTLFRQLDQRLPCYAAQCD